MNLFTWTDDLLLGVELIDNQHREYFRRVNALFDALGGREPKEALVATFEFLQEYVVEHFDAEQHIMAVHAFPGADEHMQQHEFFAGKVDAMREALTGEDGPAVVTEQVDSLLVAWFVKHIRRVDQELARHVLHRA